ncbi:MAG: alpha/beta hydrolase [Candidatus Omnitrophota bacterium]|nr:MAG: alpha/beta hydrolase [Candidatus Omnitrophota bacterium]
MVRIVIYLIVFILVMIGYVKCIEDSRIFFPVREIGATPAVLNIEFEDVYINTADNVKINGWFIPKSGAQYTVLFFHGNGGNIADRLDKIRMFYDMGLNLFIIDYRGYGKSSGRVSEKGFYIDAQAAYGYLVNTRRIMPDYIVLYGESLGAAVAIDLASNSQPAALIAEGAFGSIKEVGRAVHPFLSLFLIFDKFNSLAKVEGIGAPKLFIHSATDEIVPFSLGKKLYNRAVSPKQFVEITGGHNGAFLESQEKYVGSIKKFISNL